MRELSDNRGSLSTRTSTDKDLNTTTKVIGNKSGKNNSSKTVGRSEKSLSESVQEELKKQYSK
jgi:hypothetical protein